MNVSHLMNITATHKTKTRTPDYQGGYIYAFSTAGSYVARLSQPSAGVRQLNTNDLGKDTGHVTHELYISPAPSTTIKVGDQFIVNSRTFEVKIPNLTPSIAIYRKIGLLEIQ